MSLLRPHRKLTKSLPADKKEAGLPDADKIPSNLISSVEVQSGVILMTFGNNARPKNKDKILRP